MCRLDIRDLTEEQLLKLDTQVVTLGLKSRSEYIGLVIGLDIVGLIKNSLQALHESIEPYSKEKRDRKLHEEIEILLKSYSSAEIREAIDKQT